MGVGRAWARDLVLGLGADEFVDADRSGLEEFDPVDLVVDLVGGELLERWWSTVKAGGRLVTVVQPVPEAAERAGVQAGYFIVEPDRRHLAELAGLVDPGELRPVVGQVFDLADGAAAFEAKQGHGVAGKTVLRVVDDQLAGE